jgi:solute carrier family 25 folate transporter 32
LKGAGFVCTLICAPLDVVKVRQQVQSQVGTQKYTGNVLSIISRIYSEEGIRGVFKGVGPALLTVPIFWGVYWPIYDSMKYHLITNHPELSPHLSHLFSAISAGAVGDVITNPFWVTRTRFQTMSMHKNLNISDNIGTLAMMRVIYRQEGILAFYKGLTASFLGLSHVAIQFPLCLFFLILKRLFFVVSSPFYDFF